MAMSSLTTQSDEIKTTLATLLEAGRNDEALEMFISVLSQLATDHDRLQQKVRLLLKNRFGHKTEKIDRAQVRLFLEDLRQAPEKSDAPTPDATRPAESERTCTCGEAKTCICCETGRCSSFSRRSSRCWCMNAPSTPAGSASPVS